MPSSSAVPEDDLPVPYPEILRQLCNALLENVQCAVFHMTPCGGADHSVLTSLLCRRQGGGAIAEAEWCAAAAQWVVEAPSRRDPHEASQSSFCVGSPPLRRRASVTGSRLCQTLSCSSGREEVHARRATLENNPVSSGLWVESSELLRLVGEVRVLIGQPPQQQLDAAAASSPRSLTLLQLIDAHIAYAEGKRDIGVLLFPPVSLCDRPAFEPPAPGCTPLSGAPSSVFRGQTLPAVTGHADGFSRVAAIGLPDDGQTSSKFYSALRQNHARREEAAVNSCDVSGGLLPETMDGGAYACTSTLAGSCLLDYDRLTARKVTLQCNRDIAAMKVLRCAVEEQLERGRVQMMESQWRACFAALSWVKYLVSSSGSSERAPWKRPLGEGGVLALAAEEPGRGGRPDPTYPLAAHKSATASRVCASRAENIAAEALAHLGHQNTQLVAALETAEEQREDLERRVGVHQAEVTVLTDLVIAERCAAQSREVELVEAHAAATAELKWKHEQSAKEESARWMAVLADVEARNKEAEQERLALKAWVAELQTVNAALERSQAELEIGRELTGFAARRAFRQQLAMIQCLFIETMYDIRQQLELLESDERSIITDRWRLAWSSLINQTQQHRHRRASTRAETMWMSDAETAAEYEMWWHAQVPNRRPRAAPASSRAPTSQLGDVDSFAEVPKPHWSLERAAELHPPPPQVWERSPIDGPPAERSQSSTRHRHCGNPRAGGRESRSCSSGAIRHRALVLTTASIPAAPSPTESTDTNTCHCFYKETSRSDSQQPLLASCNPVGAPDDVAQSLAPALTGDRRHSPEPQSLAAASTPSTTLGSVSPITQRLSEAMEEHCDSSHAQQPYHAIPTKHGIPLFSPSMLPSAPRWAQCDDTDDDEDETDGGEALSEVDDAASCPGHRERRVARPEAKLSTFQEDEIALLRKVHTTFSSARRSSATRGCRTEYPDAAVSTGRRSGSCVTLPPGKSGNNSV